MFWNSDKRKPLEATPVASASSGIGAVKTSSEIKLSAIEQELNLRFGKVRSALPSGTVIQGKLSFDCAVRIDGKLGGELYSSDIIIIGETARVDANIEARTIIVLGHFNGKGKAAESVEIYPGASFSGSVEAPVLRVDEGASVKMSVTQK